jgi:peptidoglycan/xylan/chitin deacetylase (PgdA/CDA1 family)
MKLFPKIINIYFHELSEENFERMLRWFVKHNYRFISTKELLEWYLGELTFSGRLCHISFDDGKRSNMNLLHLCEKYNVPITVFVATSALHSGNFWWEYVKKQYGDFEEFKSYEYDLFQEKVDALKKEYSLERTAFTVSELVDFAKDPHVTIASHTVNHPILPQVPIDILEHELIDSRKELEKILGVKIKYFSYPNGSLSEREVEVAKNNYQCAFTTEQKYPDKNDDLMLIPRIALTGQYYRNLLKIFKIWQPIKKIFR